MTKKTFLGRTVNVIEHPNGCWEAGLRPNSEGYVFTSFGKKGRMALHAAALIDAEPPTESGMQPDHLCRNRRCCNPAHLEWVSNSENNARKFRDIGTEHLKARLDEETVLRIDGMLKIGLSQVEVARRTGVNRRRVCHIANGTAYRNITGRPVRKPNKKFRDYREVA